MTIERDLAALRLEPPAGTLERALVGVGLADQYVERPSPLGTLLVAFNERGVSAVDLATEGDDFETRYLESRGRPVFPAFDISDRIARYLDESIARGAPGRLPVDLRGLSDFQAAVLRRAASIPRGEVRPYGWIAREMGRPAAVRAVGTALATNPIPVIIPCHRVVRSDGSFGRYSLGADENKLRLLEAEGMDITAHRTLAGRGVRYVGSDTTRIYCHPSCHAARRIGASHRVEFSGEVEASRAGFRPCLKCRPAAA